MGAHLVAIRKLGSVGCVGGGGGGGAGIAREKIAVGKERGLGGQQCGAIRFAVVYSSAPAAAHWKTNDNALCCLLVMVQTGHSPSGVVVHVQQRYRQAHVRFKLRARG
jgi:hypothetical protein